MLSLYYDLCPPLARLPVDLVDASPGRGAALWGALVERVGISTGCEVVYRDEPYEVELDPDPRLSDLL